jgi:hypothetical protein
LLKQPALYNKYYQRVQDMHNIISEREGSSPKFDVWGYINKNHKNDQ